MGIASCKFRVDRSPCWEGFALGTSWEGFDEVAVVPMVQKEIVRWMVECGQCAAVVLDQMVPGADGLIYLRKPWMITVVSKSAG
jgi:hypothetical protein